MKIGPWLSFILRLRSEEMGVELFLLIEQILIASEVRSLVKSQKSIFMREYSFFFFINVICGRQYSTNWRLANGHHKFFS